jgi:prevent-host-death family protein
MSSHSVADAKAHLSNLIDRAMDGEAVIITRHGRPVVEIKPVTRVVGPMSKLEVERLMKRRVTPRTTGWNSADLIRQMRDDGN